MSLLNLSKKKVIVSAFRCSEDGTSEALVGYQFVKEIAKYCQVFLLAPNSVPSLKKSDVVQPDVSINRAIFNKLLGGLNGAVKFDYFYFDLKAFVKYRKEVQSSDLFHHITPIAPRYHSLTGLNCNKMIIGPVGGGLKIPLKFESLISKEPLYCKLRNLDKFRLNKDPLLYNTYRKAEKILVVGKYMFDILPNEFHHKCQMMLDVGIDIEDYPDVITRPFNNVVNLLYVGRIVPYKGLSLLLHALSSLESHIAQKISLDIIGSGGTYEDYCKKIAEETGIAKLCHFHGGIPKKNVFKFYKNSDIFCFPSLAEAGGTVILEAMAMALPVISINRGGPAEMLDEDCGILVDADDPEYVVQKIAQSITMLVENRDLRKKMGDLARRKIVQNFTWKAKGKALMKVYLEVLNDH